jgi:hypothetical protein
MDKTQHEFKDIIIVIIIINKHRYHKMCISVIIFEKFNLSYAGG